MEQKVIITKDESRINELIECGWHIKSVTAGNVSTYAGGNTCSLGSEDGKFCFVLERVKSTN